MKYQVVNGDLMTAPRGNVLVHCISADCALGAGIAKTIDAAYNMREKIYDYYPDDLIEVGSALLVEDVFNLVTKQNYWGKPTYATLEECLREMRSMMYEFHIQKIAMPKIGCGLDKLEWARVEELIKSIFSEDDVEITVYVL